MQGPISIQVFATPTSGLRRSASEKPTALSMARAGARLGPVVSGLDPLVTRASRESRATGASLRDGCAARIRAEDAEHRRELRQVRQRPRTREIVARGRQIRVEEVLPLAAGNRPRFELRQIDAAQREHAERLEERARLVGEREDERRLVGRRRRQRPVADDQEPRDVVLVVLNRRPERHQAEHFGGARRRDRRGIVHLFVGDQLRAARRVVGRNHLDAGQRPEEPIALRQRLRVRIDPAHPLHRAARQREKVVLDPQLHLAHDRQMMLEEQVEVAVDAAADRILDRQHAVRRRAGLDRVEDVLEGAAGHELRVGADLPRGRLAECPRFPLIRNLHTAARLGDRRFVNCNHQVTNSPIRQLAIHQVQTKRAITFIG